MDLYDYSSRWYPPAAGRSWPQARNRAWDEQLHGDHGLRFWADVARQHGVPLALPEWALA